MRCKINAVNPKDWQAVCLAIGETAGLRISNSAGRQSLWIEAEEAIIVGLARYLGKIATFHYEQNSVAA